MNFKIGDVVCNKQYSSIVAKVIGIYGKKYRLSNEGKVWFMEIRTIDQNCRLLTPLEELL